MHRRPPSLTVVSLPIVSEGRGASVHRLVCFPASSSGLRSRNGGWGRSLCCQVAWQGGWAGLWASSLGPDRAPQRACSQAREESLGTRLITGTYPLVGKMNSRKEGFKIAFVEGLDYESATHSNWKTKEGGARINLSPPLCGSLGLVWRLKIWRLLVQNQSKIPMSLVLINVHHKIIGLLCRLIISELKRYFKNSLHFPVSSVVDSRQNYHVWLNNNERFILGSSCTDAPMPDFFFLSWGEGRLCTG